MARPLLGVDLRCLQKRCLFVILFFGMPRGIVLLSWLCRVRKQLLVRVHIQRQCHHQQGQRYGKEKL